MAEQQGRPKTRQLSHEERLALASLAAEAVAAGVVTVTKVPEGRAGAAKAKVWKRRAK
jgi:hypothetical protein